jgi:hypothetical protein
VRKSLENAWDVHDNATVIDWYTRRRDVTISGNNRRRDAVGQRHWRVHHMVTGEVTDVDRNSGKVSILASDGSKLQVILPPLAVATANKGDRASIDVTIGPAR